jgi:phosphoserine phosphatase
MAPVGSHIATLIAPALDAAALAKAATLLPGALAPQWLADGLAADVPFSAEGGLRETADRLRAVLPGVDVVVQPALGRRKLLFLADMDSTMIEQECIDELADFAGLKPKIAAITERAMRGEIAFEPALRERVALLKGLPVSVIEDVLKSRITLMAGARTLIGTMKRNGAYTCLVSGGFTMFTDRIAKMIGFDETRANTLDIANGQLAGTVASPVFGRDSKRESLIELRDKRGLQHSETMAVGDGANDIGMIEEAGLGVAYRAKPAVAEVAAARIDHGDLSTLLYVQGYLRGEFIKL